MYIEAESDPKAFQKRFAPIDSSMQSTQLIDAMRFSETLLKNRCVHACSSVLPIHRYELYTYSADVAFPAQLGKPFESRPVSLHRQG